MGRTHAFSGAGAFLGVTAGLHAAGLQVDPVTALVGACAAAGGAMLPDLDHRSATVSNSLGWVSRMVATVVSGLSGGHREGTHSLVGVAVFTGVAYVADMLGGWMLGVWLGFLFALAVAAMWRMISRRFWLHTTLIVAGGVVLVGSTLMRDYPTGLLTAAVFVGASLHVAGDMFTVQGCPLLWPLSRRFRWASIRTDGIVERLIVGPVLGAGCLLLAAVQFV